MVFIFDEFVSHISSLLFSKILELVKQREEMKKDMLKSVVGIFEQRYDYH